MKKVLNVGIGGVPFSIEEEAYSRLEAYLNNFKARLSEGRAEIMNDLENRIAELFTESVGGGQVVTMDTVERVISQLGMPDGGEESASGSSRNGYRQETPPVHKLYRDPDSKRIGGVCSGLGIYFGLDISLIRIAFVIVFILGGSGLLAYLIFWLVTPEARTPTQKCELRGIPPTAENISKFSVYGK